MWENNFNQAWDDEDDFDYEQYELIEKVLKEEEVNLPQEWVDAATKRYNKDQGVK